jgi:predicted RNase H-like nuclease
MYFVGLDLAWGRNNQSGIAVLDTDGRLVNLCAVRDDTDIATTLRPYVQTDCVVAIDAPLIVANQKGYRPCETALNRDFGRFEAGARPAFRENPVFAGTPRAAFLANVLGLDMNPRPLTERRAIEVYPHPASVALFGLGRTLKYKRGSVGQRRRELLRLTDLIDGLGAATPPLGLDPNPAWAELRNKVAAATRPVDLDRAEDPVDAVLCAYIALYATRRPRDVTTYGDFASGYIVTPSLPTNLTPSRRGSASQSGSGTNEIGAWK